LPRYIQSHPYRLALLLQSPRHSENLEAEVDVFVESSSYKNTIIQF
jgi:hypothetical protein